MTDTQAVESPVKHSICADYYDAANVVCGWIDDNDFYNPITQMTTLTEPSGPPASIRRANAPLTQQGNEDGKEDHLQGTDEHRPH
ncbi:MAG TPA: hypothetical protein VGJ20_28865 [Xanthobacteraceae bacterium]|jgi:hypothetical protein